MYIKMSRDQVKPWGIFLKGQTHSLPAADVARLDVDSYVEVDVDESQLKKMDTDARVRHLNNELATLHASIQSKKKDLVELTSKYKAVAGKIKQIEAKAAEEAGAAEADKEVTSNDGSPDDKTAGANKGAAQKTESAKAKAGREPEGQADAAGKAGR